MVRLLTAILLTLVSCAGEKPAPADTALSLAPPPPEKEYTFEVTFIDSINPIPMCGVLAVYDTYWIRVNKTGDSAALELCCPEFYDHLHRDSIYTLTATTEPPAKYHWPAIPDKGLYKGKTKYYCSGIK